jgi:hypothetical protein
MTAQIRTHASPFSGHVFAVGEKSVSLASVCKGCSKASSIVPLWMSLFMFLPPVNDPGL